MTSLSASKLPSVTPRSTTQNSMINEAALTKLVQKYVFARDEEFRRHQNIGTGTGDKQSRGLPYHLVLPAKSGLSPEDIFANLRWGGRAILVSESLQEANDLAQRFTRWGSFILEHAPSTIRKPILGVPIPGLGKLVHYFTIRKIDLVRPGESSDRFTYQVQLTKRHPGDQEYIVVKSVPTVDRVISRLRAKFPDIPFDELRHRAQKFTDKIFPVFLTREAAMLKILQRDLPEKYRNRVPRCMGVEHDSRGFVKTLYMNWLCNGGKALSQLEFAVQGAELLAALHDAAGVIHLDLRLDNFVITENGVGFIDFGSAVRSNEIFSDNSLLSTLYEEMMQTSQIQKMLCRMSDQGLVTSDTLLQGKNRVDKAVDLFYLTVQFNKPHLNPDFVGLVNYNPKSFEARHIKTFTDQVLRPLDTSHPPYQSATDVLQGLYRVREMVEKGSDVPDHNATTALSGLLKKAPQSMFIKAPAAASAPVAAAVK
ncbi:MAG TPA: hypothetical protein VKJ65_07945 [Phycisphaerae bacterium]|nr:hypothetical protein [Phycisphaerae bacterium]